MSDESTAMTGYLSWLGRHGELYCNHLGETHLTITERLPYVDYDDVITHICKKGECLLDVAVYYYKDRVDRPADCWEIIANYQDDPIIDGSVPLTAGRVILIPPQSYIQEVALGMALREAANTV